MARNICKIEDCSRFCFGRGWCQLHYDRWRSHGNPMKTLIVYDNRKKHPLYSTWASMKARCSQKSMENYSYREAATQ